MNRFVNPPKQAEKQAQKGLFEQWKPDLIIKEELIITYLPNFVFVVVLGIFYISINYYAERLNTRINQLTRELENTKVDYHTLKYDYISASKQTVIFGKLQGLGLIQTDEPVTVIKVDKIEDK